MKRKNKLIIAGSSLLFALIIFVCVTVTVNHIAVQDANTGETVWIEITVIPSEAQLPIIVVLFASVVIGVSIIAGEIGEIIENAWKRRKGD